MLPQLELDYPPIITQIRNSYFSGLRPNSISELTLGLGLNLPVIDFTTSKLAGEEVKAVAPARKLHEVVESIEQGLELPYMSTEKYEMASRGAVVL